MPNPQDETIVKLLSETGYSLSKVPRSRFWDIVIETDESFKFKMGHYRPEHSYLTRSTLSLKPELLNKNDTNNTYSKDYILWHKRCKTEMIFYEYKQVKFALKEHKNEVANYRGKLTSLPSNFNRLGERNKNKLVLPFFVAAIPVEVANYAIGKGLTAYHPIVSGLTEKRISFTDLSDYENLPREWVRHLLFG